MTNCKKCGNPQKMYWCNECESNQETSGECAMCWHSQKKRIPVELDEHYHDNCNQ